MMFDVLLVDCPWPYAQRAVWQETKFGGGVHSSYPVMTDERLVGLKSRIDAIAAPNSLLLMWAVWPKMDVAIDLLKAWGFRFSTRLFTWIKTYPNGTTFKGPGYGTSSNDEVIIVGVRGKYLVPAVRLMDGVYEEEFEPDDAVVKVPHPRWPKGTPPDPDTGKPRAGKIIHSAKPEEFRRRIDMLWPNAHKLEMFARVRVPGWISVGLDITGNDIYTDLDLLARFGTHVRVVS